MPVHPSAQQTDIFLPMLNPHPDYTEFPGAVRKNYDESLRLDSSPVSRQQLVMTQVHPSVLSEQLHQHDSSFLRNI